MNLDWNWFFSSFCQSAAALIGIIGAFIISRLLGISEKINLTISDFDNLVIEYNKIISSICKRRFYWYTKTNVLYDSDLKDQIKKGEFDKLEKQEILDRIYKSDSNLFKNDKAVLDAFEEVFEKYKPKYTNVGNGLSSLNMQSIGILDIVPTGTWDRLRIEKDLINQLEIDSKTLIQYFEQNLQNLNSFIDTIKPVKIIIFLLIIAFPLTVIYPLHFMPMETNMNPLITFEPIKIITQILTFKFLLLLIFFISIESIFCYFYLITTDLKNKLKIAIEFNSEDLRNIENYSEYFEKY